MTQTNDIIIGIDVSKNKLDIYIDPFEEHKTIDNDSKKIKQFLLLQKKKRNIKLVVLEATGGHEKKAVAICSELEVPVHIGHPSQIHYFGLSKKLLAKSDKIDAKLLALFGKQEDTAPSQILNAEQQELEELARRKQQLTTMLVSEKNRLNNGTVGKQCKKSLSRLIKQLEREIKLIDEKLHEAVQKNDDKKEKMAILKSYKGVGDTTAIMLLSCLPELGKIGRTQVVSLVGLAPFDKDSGTKKGHRQIKGGRFHVRKALYMATLSAMQFNKQIRAFYTRLIEKGKKPKVAITAAMRKIIITLNAMVRDNKTWQYSEGLTG